MATSLSQYAACRLVKDRTLKLETKARSKPDYNGVVVTEDMLLVIDGTARNLQLYSRRDGKLLSSYRLESIPGCVCLISKTEVAVCLKYSSTIVILSLKSIGKVKLVKTLHLTKGFDSCHSVAKINSDKLVVSGRKYDGWMYCWGFVTITDGRVDSTHNICKGHDTHMAVKDSTVYISCQTSDSTNTGVYAYAIFNPHTLKFLYQHKELKRPGSLMADRRDFIYVSDQYSNRIHQLTDSGQLVNIHTLSSSPMAIFYDDQHEVLYTTRGSGSNVITVYRVEYSHQTVIPIEILNMDERSIQLFEEALKDGKETVNSIRIMVVGHFGVGKTTLVKRLLGEEVNISEKCSTEGIDVHVNCCDVSLSTHEWTKRTKDSEQDYRLQRLARVLNEQQVMKDKATREEQVKILSQGEQTYTSHKVAHIADEDKESDVLYSIYPQQDISHDLSSTASQQVESPSTLTPREPFESETNMIAMLKLLQENVHQLKQETDKSSPLTIWDFAGQHSFYSTYQTFLTRRAIYLLVSDVSKQLTDLVDDECYFDSEWKIKCKVHDLIEFWLNFIHHGAPSPEVCIPPVLLVGTHVDKISEKQSLATGKQSETKSMTSETGKFTFPTTSKPSATAISEQPKAGTILGAVRNFFNLRKTKGILEATSVSSMTGGHALPAAEHGRLQLSMRERVEADVTAPSADKSIEDTIAGVDAGKSYNYGIREICQKYFREIRACLENKPSRFHLVNEEFAIDNTVVDRRLEDLKRKIVELASQQPYCHVEIPARWIPLQQKLMRLKAAGVKVIPISLLTEMNQTGVVPISTEELDLFLRFQHAIGTILYFSLDVLREKIVLEPQWLIDALNSIIYADKIFILSLTKDVSEKWFEFKTKGKLYPELIDAIWTKERNQDFYTSKEYLLRLMEQLNIIVKPQSYTKDGKEIKQEDYYLASCMLRKAIPREIMSPESDPEMESTPVLCFVYAMKILPPPIFHRLVGACLTHWPIAKKWSENHIYCGCCMFDLDHHHRLTLHFRDHIIFARVTRKGVMDITWTSEICSKARELIVENLPNLGQSQQFEMHIKCPDSDKNSHEGLIAVSLLRQKETVLCHSHEKSHVLVSRQLLQYWFDDKFSTEYESADVSSTSSIDSSISIESQDYTYLSERKRGGINAPRSMLNTCIDAPRSTLDFSTEYESADVFSISSIDRSINIESEDYDYLPASDIIEQSSEYNSAPRSTFKQKKDSSKEMHSGLSDLTIHEKYQKSLQGRSLPIGMTTEWNFTAKELTEAWQSVEVYLSEELYPKHLLPFFEKTSLLSAEECEDICKLRRRQVVKELLQRIKAKLPEAFSHFIHTLNETEQDVVVQGLRKQIEGTHGPRTITHDEDSNAMVSSIVYYKMKLELLKDGCIMHETESETRAYLDNGRILFSYNMRSQCLTVETGSIVVCLRPLSNLTKKGLLFFIQRDGIGNFLSDLLKRKSIFTSLPDGEMTIHVEVYCYDKDSQSEGADGQYRGYAQMDLQESFTVTDNPQMIQNNLNLQHDNMVEEIDPLLFKPTFITRGILDKTFFEKLKNLKRRARAEHFLKIVMDKGSAALAALVDALRNNELDDLANDLCTIRDNSSKIRDEGQVDDSSIEVVEEDSKTIDQDSKLWSGLFTATVKRNEEGDRTQEVLGSKEGIEPVTPETSTQLEQKSHSVDEITSRVTNENTSKECQTPLQRRALPAGKKYHAFFSYSNTDILWVKQTVERLEKDHGFVCCEYDRDNTPGTPLLKFAADSIRNAYKTIVVMTREAFKSGFVLHEVDMAITQGFDERRKCVVPVLLNDCEIPHHLRILNYIDARDTDLLNSWLSKLVMELET